jgi:serine/threonine protein phosphatase 1
VKGAAARAAEVAGAGHNRTMRWIIGDIHGMLRPLEALVAAVERADADRELLFVGDYVNRGPDSRGVIDFLLALPRARFVRGNHDDVLDQVLSGVSYCGQPGEDYRIAAFKWFMQHGLDKTFLSYGAYGQELNAILRRPTSAALNELAARVPAAHKQFVRQLPAVIQDDDLFVAHAKWDIFSPTEDPALADRLATAADGSRYTLLWGRYRTDELHEEKAWQHAGYFGHTPVDTYTDGKVLLPVAGPKIVLLDTAVALVPHGRLTALCHETRRFIQVDNAGKVITP